MKRIPLYGAAGCLVIGAIAVAVLYIKLGAVVKTAVETWGPQATQTEVRVRLVTLSPFSGRGRMQDVFIGNPSGFKTPCALRLRSVRIAVDLTSLRSDRVVVKDILVDGPEVTFEGGSSGSNLSRIQKNVEAFAPASSSRGKSQKEKKIEIGLFKVTNGKVNLSLTQFGGRSLTLPLPDVELRDIGRESGGVTEGEAARRMFGAITGAATKAVSGAGDLLQSGARKVGKAGKAAAGLIEGLFRKKKETR